jgi:hypothetical protein
MTQPLGQGPSTWARTTQLADLEWGMPKKKVLAMFAAAHVYPKHESRNARTGEPVIVRESIALPSTPPVPELSVFASVTFDDHDKLASITLKSDYPRPATATDTVMLAAANKVMAALNGTALQTLPKEPVSWTRKTTHVVFERDDECFWFELSPTKPH